MPHDRLTKSSVLRVGTVCEVQGRRVVIKVDRNKNSSNLFFKGEILRNISVDSYIEIRKGFLSIIGKVEGEKIVENLDGVGGDLAQRTDRNIRLLTVSLSGYLEDSKKFISGTRELPLIGNEAYIVDREKMHLIHNLKGDSDLTISVAVAEHEDFPLEIPIDGVFNSHIAIFGNTGSGKSNTLALLYQEFVRILRERNQRAFFEKTKIVLFDFNGEFGRDGCISEEKQVFELSTRTDNGDRIPISPDKLLDLEILSILADATEKTQKPFLKRALNLLNNIRRAEDANIYFRKILTSNLEQILQMADKVRVFQCLDYFRQIVPVLTLDGVERDLEYDLEWHNTSCGFRIRGESDGFLAQKTQRIPQTAIYKHAQNSAINLNDLLEALVTCMYLQLIGDLIKNRAQNEHVAPVINKFVSKSLEIRRIFDTSNDLTFWQRNINIIDMHSINMDMKKTIPLLIAKMVYDDHKASGIGSLSIIVDEAHNILSRDSARESESWRDYRLEVFEEIIKEGRKFGAFLTISSQRPNDISQTIISQAHNYFIHRLINSRDLETISTAVSYIDAIAEESIPTMPTGTCIFSGVASPLPLKIRMMPLEINKQPRSATLAFSEIVSDEGDLYS